MSQNQITTTACSATSDTSTSTDNLAKTEDTTNQPLEVGEGGESKSSARNTSESEIGKREKKEADEKAPNVSDNLKRSELDVTFKDRLVLFKEQAKERRKQEKQRRKQWIDEFVEAQIAARRKALLPPERIAEIESNMRRSARATPRCVEIRNVPEEKNEDLYFVATIPRRIASILRFQLHHDNVLHSTRVLYIREGCFHLRPVVVEFRSRELRDEFLAATLAFNERAIDARSVLNTAQLGLRGAKRPVFVVEALQANVEAIYTSCNVDAERIIYRLSGKPNERELEALNKKLDKIQDLMFDNMLRNLRIRRAPEPPCPIPIPMFGYREFRKFRK